MDELEQLRAQKMAALRQMSAAQQENNQQKNSELQQQLEMLEAFVKQYLAPDAVSRLGNIKLAHPETALQVMVGIAQLVKGGKITRPLADEQFKEIIKLMTPEKKETTIKRV